MNSIRIIRGSGKKSVQYDGMNLTDKELASYILEETTWAIYELEADVELKDDWRRLYYKLRKLAELSIEAELRSRFTVN